MGQRILGDIVVMRTAICNVDKKKAIKPSKGFIKTVTVVGAVGFVSVGSSGQAWAVSSGCSALSSSPVTQTITATNVDNDNFSFSRSLDTGETIQVSFSNLSGITADTPPGSLGWQFAVGASSTTFSITLPDGNTTGTIASYSLSAPSSGSLTVAMTTAGPQDDFSAGTYKATITCTSATTASKKAFQNVQAALSRSQSGIVASNVGTRLSSAAAPAGSSDKETVSNALTSRLSLSDVKEWDDVNYTSRKGSFRDLAMMASFDSSQMVLSAAGDNNDPIKGTKQRQLITGGNAYTVWGHGSYTSIDNDRNRTGDDSRYDGDVWGYNIGVDYRYRPELVAGLSLGYSETDLITTFNNGTYDETNWTLSPYVMYQPMQDVTLSMVAGYSMGDVDRTRGTVTGKTDSSMWFAGLNGSYKVRPVEKMPLDLTAKVGFLISQKTIDAFDESDSTRVEKSISNTRQLKPGIEAAYAFDMDGTSIQPFAKTDYLHDFKNETNGDSGAFNVGGGVRVASSTTGISGSLEGEKQYGRSDYTEHTISGMVAYSFAIGGHADKTAFAEPYVKTNFTKDGQVYGTGMKFTSDGGAVSANFDITQTAPSNGVDDNLIAKVGAKLKF